MTDTSDIHPGAVPATEADLLAYAAEQLRATYGHYDVTVTRDSVAAPGVLVYWDAADPTNPGLAWRTDGESGPIDSRRDIDALVRSLACKHCTHSWGLKAERGALA